MKAVQIKTYGGNEVLEVQENAPKPIPKKGQTLVEVHAAGVNPVDWKIRAGYLKDMAELKFPATLGGDFAGVVTEVGENVSDFQIGDEVYGSALTFNGGSGSFAEFAAAKITTISRKPARVNFVEAAALPLVGSSAIQALEEHIKLQSGQKILIHGGVGGIGMVAIQLAKTIGAYVATTVSTDDKEYVKQLGAQEIIDYKKQKFEELLKEYDAVFDTVGGETTSKSFGVLKKGGVLVSMVGMPDQKLAIQYGVAAIGQMTNTNTTHLKRLAELVDDGKIKVHIDKTFTLEQASLAFEYQEKVHPRGKIVFTI